MSSVPPAQEWWEYLRHHLSQWNFPEKDVHIGTGNTDVCNHEWGKCQADISRIPADTSLTALGVKEFTRFHSPAWLNFTLLDLFLYNRTQRTTYPFESLGDLCIPTVQHRATTVAVRITVCPLKNAKSLCTTSCASLCSRWHNVVPLQEVVSNLPGMRNLQTVRDSRLGDHWEAHEPVLDKSR